MSRRTTSGIIAVDKRSLGPTSYPIDIHRLNWRSGTYWFSTTEITAPTLRGSYTLIVELQPVRKATEWQYADTPRTSFYCPFKGNAQRLWNGNTTPRAAAYSK
jgi:hypothetical protein